MNRDSILSKGTRLFIRRNIQTGSGAAPAFIRLVTIAVLPVVKREEREADNFSLFIAKVRNGGAVTLLPRTSSRCHASLFNPIYNLTFSVVSNLIKLYRAVIDLQHTD
jgi:hypothetical protein